MNDAGATGHFRSGARPALRALVVALACGAAAAAADDDVVLFSHVEHQQLEEPPGCIDCHDARATGVQAPWIKQATCIECHDEVPELAARARPRGLAVPFDHRPHADTACASCHLPSAPPAAAPAGAPAAAEHRLGATSATCLACHERDAAAPREAACARCHQREQRRVAPASHGPSWRSQHANGAFALMPADHGASCTLCHRESACVACHRVERPRDHDGLWRTRLHGSAASWDRARCQTCHEPGQCIACHREEEPANHRGAWTAAHGLVARGKHDASCQACHRQTFCNDCHRGIR
ncbi:MAG: hypothetical protein A2138_23810 [Deltaproteobacteria bacterium RBG_16_71_12]|nr:MAG: hypothetical protein A2138_23810 [Deltaproteobacteria bacterium RBG_16_71_12]